jgi:predicted anti-sigma-YlaC factor YlaD
MAALSAVVDREVPMALAKRIEAHVAECQACARFGHDFARLLELMRQQLATPEPVPAEVAARLMAAIRR